MNILIFFIILLVLVLVHEFGHFFTAKKFGIRVDEFGFGFPPKIFGYKKGETEYSLNLLPLGGFVKIYGENPEVEQAHYGAGPDDDRKFYNKPKYKQAIVLFAGVFANFLLAWFLFSVGFMSGFPTSVGNSIKGYELSDVNLVVISIEPKSPAELSGLKSGDKILSIQNENDFTSSVSPETLKSFVINSKGKEIEIGYVRGGEKEQFVKLVPSLKSGTPMIGISMDQIGVAKLSFFRAFEEGMRLTLNMVKGTALGLYMLITEGIRGQDALSSITGPVGMVGIVGDAYELGFVYLLSFAALISVNLAVINLLPFPALDGGRLLFLLIEKIKGSRINSKFTNIANMVGFGIFILLMLVVTYRDVVKLF